MKKLILCLFVLSFCQMVYSENEKDYTADTQSPEALVDAVYQIVSANKNQQRDGLRFRNLFFENVKFTMAIKSPQLTGLITQDLEEMIEQTEKYYKPIGFHEIELDKKVISYGDMASVYSAFYVKTDEQELMRGINHFQLLFDGDRWWIISNITTLENEDFKLPSKL